MVARSPLRAGRGFWLKLALAILAAGALALVVSTHPAWARGGGGGHGGGGGGGHGGGFSGGGFSGSGYSGGGGFGGGFGSGLFPFPLLFFGGLGGGLLWILLIVMFIGLIRGLLTMTAFTHPVPVASGPPIDVPPPDAEKVQAMLAAMMADDPAFNERVFIDRAQAAFFLLQKAWMQKDLSISRAVMSEGIYQRWKVQIDQMAAAHKKNMMDNLVVLGAAVVKVERDARFEALTVQIDASAADYEVDEQTGKIVFGSQTDQPFTEYWTFVRSAGTKTRDKPGVMESKCPNCGAPLTINESGVCHYCNVVVTSGSFDWVLDNITQAYEWRG
jgi:hypothetical protein